MLTIKLLLITGHCRFDLGSGAALIRSEFAITMNTVHIVNASRYAINVMINNYSYPVYHCNVVCIEWDKLVNCQWTIGNQFRTHLLVKQLC